MLWGALRAPQWFGLSHSWRGQKTPVSLCLGHKSPGSEKIPTHQADLGHRVLGTQQAGLEAQVREEGWAAGNAPNRKDSLYI